MEPIEINAGAWYLRGVRDDERISDAAALRDLGVDDPEAYVRQVDSGWADESSFTWAVCEPTTGELVATVSVVLDADRASVVGHARDGYDDALAAAYPVVARFATGALGVTMTEPQT